MVLERLGKNSRPARNRERLFQLKGRFEPLGGRFGDLHTSGDKTNVGSSRPAGGSRLPLEMFQPQLVGSWPLTRGRRSAAAGPARESGHGAD